MNWVDIISLALLVVVILIFTLRGREAMGSALFDMAALVVAAWSTHKLYAVLGELTGLGETATYIILFVLLSALLLFVASRLFKITQLAFNPFDVFLSFLFGIVAAWAVTYALLEVIMISVTADSRTAEDLRDSRVATEILQFRTLTGTKALLDSARFHQREEWEQPAPYQQK
ncbi:MAG: hypothetical protein ABIK86_01660 [candidate division WOR-3 bacterium]